MTIERNTDWGESGPLPEDGVVATTDIAASVAIRNAYDGVPPIGLIGGDLRRTLGGRRGRGQLRQLDATRVIVDYGIVSFEDQERPFVAHVIARRGLWRGPLVAVMNAAFLGAWNVAPKAHPGDGKFDVLEADLSLSDRLKARRRLPSGTHVPHPGISESRGAEFSFKLDNPLDLWVDNKNMGRVDSFSVKMIADGLQAVV